MGRLKEIRKEKNYTVKQITESLKISKSYYYQIESKVKIPSLKIAKKIELFFEVPMEELFCDLFEDVVEEMKKGNSL